MRSEVKLRDINYQFPCGGIWTNTDEAVTVYATAPDNTQYPACTTIHYGFKPSSRSVSLTIDPQVSCNHNAESALAKKKASLMITTLSAEAPLKNCCGFKPPND